MTLRKRYRRNVKNNLSFYFCVCILTMLVSVLYLDFDAASIKVGKDLDLFYEKFEVEDAEFRVAKEIEEDDIRKLEEEYDIVLEKQQYIFFLT